MSFPSKESRDDITPLVDEDDVEFFAGVQADRADQPKYKRIKRQKENFDRWFEMQSKMLAQREAEDDPSSDEDVAAANEQEAQRYKIVSVRNIFEDSTEPEEESKPKEPARAKEGAQPSESKSDNRQKIAKRYAYVTAREAHSYKQEAISVPRDYQLELFEASKEGNVIAVLETGSGKTLISCMLMKHVLSKEMEQREAGLPKRVIFFLVNSVILVFQQAAVIEANVPAKINKLCGQMGVDIWEKDLWQKQYQEYDIIVMTADIYYNCLNFGFLDIQQASRYRQASLLIFDECHHSKRGHVFRRIMTEFYGNCPREVRPRVFGMTASPVDAKGDVEQAITDLERVMCAQIRTPANMDLVRAHTAKSETRIQYYDKSPHEYVTPLYQKLYAGIGGFKSNLRKLLTFSEWAAVELGPWCADHIWHYLLNGHDNYKEGYRASWIRELVSKATSDTSPQQHETFESQLELDLHVLAIACDIVEKHEFQEPKLDVTDFSYKVLNLIHFIKSTFMSADNKFTCIIFVQRRFTAWVFYDLIKKLKVRGCKPGILTGHGGNGVTDLNMTFREQSMLMYDFRRRKVNCLIATSVAEEGIDIPDCNIIVRFDQCNSAIQLVQSRGRARQSSSLLVHMIERTDNSGLRRLNDVTMAEHKMREFCEKLPKDRILAGFYGDDITGVTDDNGLIYIESTTGARISSGSCLMILSTYVSSLIHDSYSVLRPIFSYETDGTFHICTISMPSVSGVLSMTGERRLGKNLAKRDAAFRLVVELRRKNLIDEHMRPYRVKKVRLLDQKKKEVSAVNANKFSLRSPSFWKLELFDYEVDGVTHALETFEMYGAVFEMPNHKGSYRPLCILSRKKHPAYYSFPLFVDGEYIPIECRLTEKPFKMSIADMIQLSQYTVRLFYDVYNKLFDADMRKLPYYIAPISDDSGSIDWDLLKRGADSLDQQPVTWEDKPDAMAWQGAFVVDMRNRNRRFELRQLMPELTEDSAIPSWFPSSEKHATVKRYTYGSKAAGNIPSSNQPVFAAKRVLHGQNFLKASSAQEGERGTDAVVIPGPFYISAIDAPMMWAMKLLPSIMFHVESCLQASELRQLLQLSSDIKLRNLVEAITVESAHLDYNYERLEVLGDAFLKASTSIALYVNFPEEDKYSYHKRRLDLICNQNLYETAIELKMYEYIRSLPFSRRTWYPDLLQLVHGSKEIGRAETHELSDKALADVGEAIIGASYLEGLDYAVHAVSQLVRSADHDMHKWADYSASYKPPQFQVDNGNARDRQIAKQISEITGYDFKSPLLVRTALTHPSCIAGIVPSYERLEFMGDALVEVLCVQFVYEKYPSADPQYLTEHKISIVNNKFLGYLCTKLGLHKYLDYVSSALSAAIGEYLHVIEFEEARTTTQDQVWTRIDVPKALADCVEALIGAIFIDSDFDLTAVQGFFNRHMRPYFEDFSPFETYMADHPTTQLAQQVSSVACNDWKIQCRELKINGTTVVLSAVQIHGRIIGSGESTSLRNARFDACVSALKRLKAREGLLESLCTCVAERERALLPDSVTAFAEG
ncbi:uncharacterized protein V1518DRAFT_404946 [Limtongia smithiae]|uniref:uncharacterized protein n=1 Tax=Limtongia smithiae TaxID=1125753 RepID=UPI0034CDA179